MNDLEFIWRRWAESKAEMSLVAVVPVRVPMKSCRAETLLYVANEYPLLNEYTLRLAAEGFTKLDAYTRFLGLPSEIVVESVSEEIAAGNLAMDDAANLSLTLQGHSKIGDLRAYETRPFKFDIEIDMISGSHYPQGSSLTGGEMDSYLERLGFDKEDARPLPQRYTSKVDRLTFSSAELNKILDSKTSKVLEVRRAYKMGGQQSDKYRLAYALVYADNRLIRTELEFLIDGEFSEMYRQEFLADNPEELLQIRIDSPAPPASITEALVELSKDQPQLSEALVLEVSKLPILDLMPSDVPLPKAVPQIGPGQFCANEMIPGQLSVFEHPTLLSEALMFAANRLVIFSPWLTSAVVNHSFMRNLTNCLKRGVVVHIVYGFGDNSGTHESCVEKLCGLANEFSNFHFLRHENSHAKTFIVDNLVVVTSFNWLSFRGDSNRTYRNEEGMQFTGAEFADKWYQGFLEQARRETVPACSSGW